MALIVHKYGGTSMGSTERIRNVAKRVAKWARAGHQMVVVPSTAQLQELLDQVNACTTRGHRIHIKVGAGFVQRSGPVLTWYNP